MLKIAVCDDQEDFLHILEQEIKLHFASYDIDTTIQKFSSSYDCLKSYQEEFFDLIFLDIHLPNLDGFELSSLLKKHNNNLEIIFITALDDVVYQAFDYKPFGFIRKQFYQEELKVQIERYMQLLQTQRATIIIEDKENNCIRSIPLKTILYIESDKNYVEIHTQNEIFRKRQTMQEIEKELTPYGFFRCHAGFLINIKHWVAIKDNKILLASKKEIPISPLKRKLANQLFLAKFRRHI